ncbi:MAG: GreA/GreB family elongation factor [Steroidobacteraceae bacterium]
MLRGLLASRPTTRHDQEHLDELRLELDRALVLDPSEMPSSVVTLGATVSVVNMRSGERQELVLVSPAESDVSARRISVLAPLGTALLGYREGDEVEWLMPGGLQHLRIERVQQAGEDTGEAAGGTLSCGNSHQLAS